MENPPPSAVLNTILLVDDSDEFRVTAKWFFTHFGYAVESVQSAEQALMVFNAKTHDIVITDNSMPGMSGLELAHVIKLRSASTPVLMHTGHPPRELSCVDCVVQRPAHLLTLKEAVEQLLRKRASR